MSNPSSQLRPHAVPSVKLRDTPEGLTIVEIDNAQATASVCLQGGHVMTWRPKSEAQPVLWLSPLAKLAPGKSIRGGVPVCWPWFGPHPIEPGFPGHGYARTVPWALARARELGDGATELTLELVESEQTRKFWPHRTRLSARVAIGGTLRIELTTENLEPKDIVIGEALHTYFQISDIADIAIRGLDSCDYHDKVGASVRRRQDGDVTFDGETDRIYVDTESECIIDDKRLGRRIHIAKTGSRSTVVWSPWTAKADRMGDFGPDGWRGMVCVESANAAENVVTVPAGGRHTLGVEYRVERR